MSETQDDKEKVLAQPAPTEVVDTGVVHAQTGMRRVTGSEAMETLDKLTPSATFEELAGRIPAVKAMVGMDQRSDYHSLTLDGHTKEVTRNIAQDPFIANHPKRDLIILAALLHDVGKTSPKGQQIHPKDPEKRQYVGHAEESARMVADILVEHFVALSEEDKELVIALARLHAGGLTLGTNFTANNQPKGKQLGSYDKFLEEVEKIPGSMPIEEKMRIIFAINRADKLGGWNENSNMEDPKVLEIIKKAEEQVRGLDELEKALPVLIQAIYKRRKGETDAGISYNEATGEYSVSESKREADKSSQSGLDGTQIGIIMKNAGTLGIPNDQKGAFGKALREGGIPALGRAGFGKYISAVKALLKEQ